MIAITQGLMGLGTAGGATIHWRLNITATQTSDTFFAQAAEIQMRTTSGGSNAATGGVATASTSFASNPPSLAFDGNNATSWASDTSQGSPQWIAYQFTSAVNIVEVTVTSGDNSTRALRAPGTFNIQSSPDGITWTTVWTVTGSTGWGVTQTRVFTKP